MHALAQIYNRHIVVHSKGHLWTTVKLDENITEDRLLEVCEIHLLYMGSYVFTELKRKPYSTPNPCGIVTDPMQLIQAMKKSIKMDIPTPLNLWNISTQASSATVTLEQVSTLSTNVEQYLDT